MTKDKKFFHGHIYLAEERARFFNTQQEAADYFGVSRVTWGQYERGNATPSGDVLAGLAQMGADVLYILTGQRSTVPMAATTPTSPRPAISPRQRALLDNYEATSDEGRRIIEATASAAAQPQSLARRRA